MTASVLHLPSCVSALVLAKKAAISSKPGEQNVQNRETRRE